MKTLRLLLLVPMVNLLACAEVDVDRINWTHEYQLTGCADPWNWSADDDLTALEGIVRTYLEEQEIDIRKIAVIEFPEGGEDCEACFCKSERKALLRLNEQNREKLLALPLESYQQWTEIND